MGPLTAMREVVWVGVVQWSSTVSPMRWAARSFTGSGRLREGAKGGAGLAHPMAHRVRIAAAAEGK
jgi:hypothetical protein